MRSDLGLWEGKIDNYAHVTRPGERNFYAAGDAEKTVENPCGRIKGARNQRSKAPNGG